MTVESIFQKNLQNVLSNVFQKCVNPEFQKFLKNFASQYHDIFTWIKVFVFFFADVISYEFIKKGNYWLEFFG